MNQLRQTIESVAPTNSRVMINGPSGSGKELVARAIHALSTRRNGPFVSINAATITPERMEIELFGTEANGGERKVGRWRRRIGGTLYIDEIADMPRETQAQDPARPRRPEFERVGGTKGVKVDVRIISSTARNLEQMIAQGRFREDLYHRLAVVPIRRAGARRAARGHSPNSSTIFMKQMAAQAGIRPRGWATTRWPCCRRTTGRAMSASCATTSSG
jgi:two-component system, NtrC family, nitrogen regulation response regulator NtrX